MSGNVGERTDMELLRGADNRLLSPQSRKVNHGEYFWFPLRGRKPKGARLPLPASHPGPRMGALALGRQSLPRQRQNVHLRVLSVSNETALADEWAVKNISLG